MSISIPQIAKDNAEFIREKLHFFELALDPLENEDEELVRRAVFSVRNKVIKFEKYNAAEHILFGTVNDVRETTFSVSFLDRTISCSCPVSNCRHELGVLLALYQYFGSVQEWTANWRSQKKQQLQLLDEERSPANWKNLIANVAKPFFPANRAVEIYQLGGLIQTVHNRLLPITPMEIEWKPIFKLYAEFVVLNIVWEHYIAHHSNFKSDNFGYLIERRKQNIEATIENSHFKSTLFAQEPFLCAIQDEMRTFALYEVGLPKMRFDLYCTVSVLVFNNSKSCQRELAALPQIDSSTQPFILFQYMLLKDTKMVRQVMELMVPGKVDYYAEVAHYALASNQRELAGEILMPILPYLKAFIQHEIQPMHRPRFCKFLSRLFAGIDISESQELELFQAFGRFGLEPYSESLIIKERYEEWVAFNCLYISSIPYLESVGLKKVVEKAPAAALPIYHLYAVEEINQKSRANYKHAVRIWRSMKSTAKKAGKLDYFEQYMATIQTKYKRLRALQEEILKANLTS